MFEILEQVIHNKSAEEVKAFFNTDSVKILKYLCKSQRDLMTYIKERKDLASAKRNEDRRMHFRINRSVTSNIDKEEEHATSAMNLLDETVNASTLQTSSYVVTSSTHANPSTEWLLEKTVEKVNSRDFHLLKFIETDVSG